MCLLNPTYAQIQKKVMSHSWENIITDGWTDGQTELNSLGTSAEPSI